MLRTKVAHNWGNYRVRQTEVQWVGLILVRNRLRDHGLPLSQVSMLSKGVRLSNSVGFPKSFLVNTEFQCKLCSSKKYEIQKVLSLAILGGLLTASHSVALSHY